MFHWLCSCTDRDSARKTRGAVEEEDRGGGGEGDGGIFRLPAVAPSLPSSLQINLHFVCTCKPYCVSPGRDQAEGERLGIDFAEAQLLPHRNWNPFCRPIDNSVGHLRRLPSERRLRKLIVTVFQSINIVSPVGHLAVARLWQKLSLSTCQTFEAVWHFGPCNWCSFIIVLQINQFYNFTWLKAFTFIEPMKLIGIKEQMMR